MPSSTKIIIFSICPLISLVLGYSIPISTHFSSTSVNAVASASNTAPLTNHSIPHSLPPELLGRDQVQPFFNKYCIDCHGEKKQKGQVRLDNINWEIADNDSAQRWQDILDQLNSGDMPPEDEEQPSHEHLQEILASLTNKVDNAQSALANHQGEIKMRRLNRREYVNSIYQLLGFKIPQNQLPEDVETEDFDTIGEDQFFTSLHLEIYLDIGKSAALKALNWTPKPLSQSKKHRIDPTKSVIERYKKIVTKGDKQMAQKKAGKSWQEIGFKDAGQAKILFSQFWARIDLPRRYLELPQSDQGVYLTSLSNGRDASAHVHIDKRAQYKFRMRGGYVGNPIEARKVVKLETHHKKHKRNFKFTSPSHDPEIIETILEPHFDARMISLIIRQDYEGLKNGFNRKVSQMKEPQVGNQPWSPIWIDWMEFEGPIYPESAPLIEKIIFPKGRTKSKKPEILKEENVRQFIEEFCFQAFRRQKPAKNYVDKLYNYYKHLKASGIKYNNAMAEIMGIVLSSPKFLYIVEPSAEPTGYKYLGNRELAIRLSYFLWSSPPDEELYAADLSDSTILNQQFERLLNDSRADAFKSGFMSQWAELDRFDAITVDKKEYKTFTPGLRKSARQETIEFLGVLIDENLPAENLIDSEFVMVDHTLATHYGIDDSGIKKATFSKVKLPKDSPRGGLTTQTAFLTLGSNGERTSPVIRGAFLMEKLLHDKPLPPPPNVPELGSATDDPLTNRQLVKLHQQQKVCSSCHKKMDAIGFGLENFDVIGRWRDTETVKKKQVPIDASSKMPDGKAFNNIFELKKLLLTEKDQLAEELLKSMMSYALGRTIQFSDQTQIDSILQKLKKDNYKVRSMLKEVVFCQLFKKK